jgi:hypothetical protein
VLTGPRARKIGRSLVRLAAHETTTEKVVHQLVVHDDAAVASAAD